MVELDLPNDNVAAKALGIEHSSIRRPRKGANVGEKFIAHTLAYANSKRRRSGEQPVRFEQIFEVSVDDTAA